MTGPEKAASPVLTGTWADPEIVRDPRIDHESAIVRRAAEDLHNNESMHLHWYIAAVICPYCALRATRVVRLVMGIAVVNRARDHRHFCLTCSPGDRPGPGCINCRQTGMDQTPCVDCPGPDNTDSPVSP